MLEAMADRDRVCEVEREVTCGRVGGRLKISNHTMMHIFQKV